MNIDVITDILEQAGLGAVGEVIFQDHMPDDVDTGIMVRLPTNGIPVDSYLPGYYRSGKVQAIARAPLYETGKALAQGVLKALTIMSQTEYRDVNGTLVMRINNMRPVSLPIVFPRTPGNLTEWSINFDANYIMP